MADVTGPISTLSGSHHDVPPGTMCDDHPDRPAVKRVQGETDSFGSEMIDMCQECLDEYVEAVKTAGPRIGTCDWCKATGVEVKDHRDFEEGLCGRVYDVCRPCIKKESDRLREDEDDPGDFDDGDLPDDDEDGNYDEDGQLEDYYQDLQNNS